MICFKNVELLLKIPRPHHVLENGESWVNTTNFTNP